MPFVPGRNDATHGLTGRRRAGRERSWMWRDVAGRGSGRWSFARTERLDCDEKELHVSLSQPVIWRNTCKSQDRPGSRLRPDHCAGRQRAEATAQGVGAFSPVSDPQLRRSFAPMNDYTAPGHRGPACPICSVLQPPGMNRTSLRLTRSAATAVALRRRSRTLAAWPRSPASYDSDHAQGSSVPC